MPAVEAALDTLKIWSYHAHVYFKDALERSRAELLRERIGMRFSVQLGRWHDREVGPHTQSMYQVAFAPELFASFVPWLMQNRLGLTILLHPNTGQPRADHMTHAFWFGAVLAVKEESLPETMRLDEEDPVLVNTTPTLAVAFSDEHP
jgi:DOPA 4,5-dioxygenase